MAEQVFTIFAGPDEGRQFVLSDAPTQIGRDAEYDVVLDDDRASRLHATLRFGEGRIVLCDENSSNGTFLNGVLIEQAEVNAGDIIAIGRTQIVCGSGAPSEARLREISARQTAPSTHSEGIGGVTEVLPQTKTAPGLQKGATRPIDILEAVADSGRPVAEKLGLQISVETDTEDGGGTYVYVDRTLLYQSLAELLALLLNNLPAVEGTLALRYGHDVRKGGGHVELLAVCFAIPTERIRALEQTGALAGVHRGFRKNNGLLRVLPDDSPDVLARIHLPSPPERSEQQTVVT